MNTKRLVHVMVCAAYRDGWGYQENILPKKHARLGYDVHLITFDQFPEESAKTLTAPRTYTSRDGLPVHVLAKRKKAAIEYLPKVRAFYTPFHNATVGLGRKLEELSPDIIFVHGVSLHDHLEVAGYAARHPEVRLYVDNHADYYNSPVNGFSGRLITRRHAPKVAEALNLRARMFWGVTPWRVKYLQDVYKVPADKTDLLVMGGDEELIDFDHRDDVRRSVRAKYGIPDDAFLVVTGGKIDRAKNVHLLAEAVRGLSGKNVWLLIFGKYEPDMEGNEVFNAPNIINAGWLPAEQSYPLFLAGDLAIFPGTHSVLWEQACASGIPAVFKDWNGGFAHVDVGGNAILLKHVTTGSLRDTITGLLHTPSYDAMSLAARTVGRSTFSYTEIAKRAVEYDKFEGKG